MVDYWCVVANCVVSVFNSIRILICLLMAKVSPWDCIKDIQKGSLGFLKHLQQNCK